MEPLKELKDTVTTLPRGGYLVQTPIGYIQFGAPPETIKDTMLLPESVPQIFVLGNKLFSWEKGISTAELEFPVYYNFFLKKRKTLIVCTEEQSVYLKKTLQEAVFGPENIDLTDDYDMFDENVYIPDITKEMEYFRAGLKLNNLVEFGIFKDNKYTIKNITIKIADDTHFQLFYNSQLIAEVPSNIEYTPSYKIGERLPEPFIPPLFGVTCLGPSHGFDPYENTSGYIIWLNHSGIMVDPPVNSTEWLEDSNVNPKFIDSIILTHCHADHDAGTFQKIIEEGKITIYTTKTIMKSFLRKYSALTNISADYLRQLFEFYPVKINRPVFIHGGRFDMFYSLHSIPTMGFTIRFQDQSFVYSSDHNNDPELHKKLLDEGIIDEKRYEQLRNFPWDSNVIYHEAGIPPLHTPVKYLNSLPEEIQKKIVVYHIAKKDFPEKTSLTLAKFGIENTLYFKTEKPEYEKSYQILEILKSMDLFNEFSVEKVQEFITIVEEEKFKKGDIIIRSGSVGDKFYIIYLGNVSVKGKDLEAKKIYGTYDYFGEVALITEKERTADVVAETNVVAYSIEKDKFLSFISGTQFEKMLLRLSKVRSSETWNILSKSRFFKYITAWQKTWLESMFMPVEITEPSVLIKEGEPIKEIYIIRKGEIEVFKSGEKISILKEGDFVGSMQSVYKDKPSDFTFRNNNPVLLYAIKKDDIVNFLKNNPGLIMRFVYDF